VPPTDVLKVVPLAAVIEVTVEATLFTVTSNSAYGALTEDGV